MQHISVFCYLNEQAGCFDQMARDGWEYMGSHIVAQPQPGKILQGPPQLVPCLFSMWRREAPAGTELPAGAVDILGLDGVGPEPGVN